MNTFPPKQLISIISLAFLSVFSHWNFWSYDVYAVGFNTSFFWLALILLCAWHDKHLSWYEARFWLIPIALIIVSFSLYENLWLKTINIIVLPIAISVFFSQNKCGNKGLFLWSYSFIFKLCQQTCKPLLYILPSALHFQSQIQSTSNIADKQKLKQIVLGVVILIPLAAFALILLSSADANFNNMIEGAFQKIFLYLDIGFIFKAIISILLSILLLAILMAWSKPWQFSQAEGKSYINAITTIIIMSGLLFIYILFLILQIEYLFIDSLPIEFNQAEHLVKSGFWQLFFLSFLNIILFTIFYKNTSLFAQYFVSAFIAASGFLLLSAAWRMSLYVFYYGFSHEKFFASYTCLFALGLFIVLMIFSLIKEEKNLLKLILFSALWCYAIACILPIEKIIFHSNSALSTHPDTRINLNHLSALSVDIYNNIYNNIEKTDTPYIQKIPHINGFYSQADTQGFQWSRWLEQQLRNSCQRPWYEKNISAFIHCSNNN